MLPKLSSKDKSLLLLIACGLVVLWFSFSFLAKIFFSSAYATSDAAKITSQYKNSDNRWLNVTRPLKKIDLKNRIILLDFWTYACVNCIHAIPEIKKLEQEFGDKLTVIGVHSGKFSNEKDFDSIKKAVLKHDITHPVIDDSDLKIWNSFEVEAWPTLLLIDPHGNVKKTYVGENDLQYVRKDVKRMINKYRYELNRNELPKLLEKNKIAKRVLSYPTKIAYGKNFSYKSYKGPALFIANSGRNTILATTLSGEVLVQIGSSKSGLNDGDLSQASFGAPSGLLFKNNKLYVADTQNHALREVDFNEEKVRTLVGSGVRGPVFNGNNVAANSVLLASPSDVEFFPDENIIAISNSGTHQILSYNINNRTVSLLAGSGFEGIDDGKLPYNSLAQTADLHQFSGKLYFIDSETSSLRVLDKSGVVTTLIGKGLFEFGHKSGDKNSALMQHPLGLTVDSKGAYITDSFNHRIVKYDFASKTLRDLVGDSVKGDELGSKTQLDEPEGIITIDDNFYVADTNNNRLIKISRIKLTSSLIDVMPQLQLPKDGFLQYLPNLHKEKLVKVNGKNLKIKIYFEDNWKLNELGPSFINILEFVDEKEAYLIKTFDWNMIKDQELTLPKLDKAKKYMMQGTIYYCENKRNAPCYVNSYEQLFEISDEEKNDSLNIELIYQ